MGLELWLDASQGVWRVISVEDWAEIRRLHRAENMGIRAIARHLGVARNTVRDALRSDLPPRYERQRGPSRVDAFEPAILELLRQFPNMPTTVIAERVEWPGGMTVFKERVRELRPLFQPPDPCQRTHYSPGELAQFDLWQPDALIPVGFEQATKCWVIVGVLGYSRFIGAWMIPSRAAHDVLSGHLRVVEQFGAVPRKVVWDQEGAIGQWRGRQMSFSAEFSRFRGTLGMGAVLCQRADPEAKGVVERANGYFETSFLPGRRFADVADFNRQLTSWLVTANNRIHETTKRRPAEAIFAARGSMLSFPPVLPDTTLRFSTRLPRDHYVRVDTNDYSVNPRFVARRIEVRVSLEEVVVTCAGTEVARHRRCLARHQSLLHPDHARALRAMRAEAVLTSAFAAAVEERDLSVYDRIEGVG